MHRSVQMLLSASAIALVSTNAYAQDAVPAAQPADAATAAPAATEEAQPGDQTIVVTARKRTEVLQDVPVAVTAVSGETIEKRGLTQIKDVANLTPSLNVNSDGVGRVFIAVRGVGTTLVGTVQPGVGIFVDGVYQPNSSYLNNPLVDVERVEILRGPQGTLYGKNTLGGAISVITRQPSNRFSARAGGSYAGPDNAWDAYGSVSGPIIEDKLQVKVAASHREQEGFIKNEILDTHANTLNMDTLTATVRAAPVEDVVLTVNGYYDWVKGNSIPYSHIDGPTDYQRTVFFNAENKQFFRYKGINAKLQVAAGTDTDITLIGSFDERDGFSPDLDGDFNAIDLVHQTSRDKLKTSAAELRFDSEWSDQISTLIGFYYSHETLSGRGKTVTQFAPLGTDLTRVNSTIDSREGDSYAAFGNVFWKPKSDLEVALGLRLDHEKRTAGGALGQTFLLGTVDLEDAPFVPPTAVEDVSIKSTKLLPKATVTKHWNDEIMTYASISKGFRGGGFNGPTAPSRTYKGDSVWTYELGSKYFSADHRLSVAGAIFYNDYKHYIGLNQFIRGTDNNAVTVDLNTGDVKSYGAEVEFIFKPVRAWTLTGGASYVHARVTDDTDFHEATTDADFPNGRILVSKRLPFQPDWSFNLNSDYVVPLGKGDLTLSAGAVAKGSRIGATISETRAPVLKSYVLFNTAVTYAIGKVEIGAFVNNLFDKKYYNSFIEKSTLERVFGPGALASDLGIIGDRRRYGVRARFRY
jgi:iron complex outermembrane receptor protein